MCNYSTVPEEHESELVAEALRLGGRVVERRGRARTAERRRSEAGGAQPRRGLSFINKVTRLEVEVVDGRTGEVFVVDQHKARIARMRRRVKAWSEALKDYIHGRRYRVVMITLTYRPGVEWQPGHIRDFMRRVRRGLGDGLVGYAWVAEMQLRGAVHYHVLLVVRRGVSIPKPDKAGWWLHGLTRIETARTVFYILKYTGKEHQKVGFPKGLRVFAVWIAKDVLTAVERLRFRLSALPSWLVNVVSDTVFSVLELPRRKSGGGWCLGGRVYRSPYRVRLRPVS